MCDYLRDGMRIVLNRSKFPCQFALDEGLISDIRDWGESVIQRWEKQDQGANGSEFNVADSFEVA